MRRSSPRASLRASTNTTRYGFRKLLEHNCAAIWQPDIHWCGGLTELRRIAALAAAYDIPVIPHTGGTFDCIHFSWRRRTRPGPSCSCRRRAGRRRSTGGSRKTTMITRGPEGIYARPSERPGFGWDIEVS